MTSFSVERRIPRSLALLAAFIPVSLTACDKADDADRTDLTPGQSEFESAPPQGASRGGPDLGGVENGGDDGAESPNAPGDGAGGGDTRKVEETDLYRLEGDRLYYLNSYRGLMVFDVSNVDAPKLLGRSPIFGEPVEMVVRDGIASVVVADWYGKLEDGTPFPGSIVRGIDARDPANMKVTGEALLGGWVRDTRVVGDVLYAVTEKYPWDYGWYGLDGDGGVATSGNGAEVSVSSVSFVGGNIQQVDSYDVPGYGGVFNVTANAILLASDIYENVDQSGYGTPTGTS